MKVKKHQPGSAKWLFKRIPSQLKRKLWLKTLASKKKLLGFPEKNMSWTTLNDSSTENDSQSSGETSSSEDEGNDSRAIVVDLPKNKLNSSSFLNESAASQSTPFLDSSSPMFRPKLNASPSFDYGKNKGDPEDSDSFMSDDTLPVPNAQESTVEYEEEITAEDEPEIEEDVEEKICVFESEDTVVAVLQHPLEVILCGRAVIQSISGTVSVCGYRLDGDSPGPVCVYSSHSFTFLTLRTEEPEQGIENATYCKYISHQLAQIGAKSICNHVLSVLNSNSVVVALQRAPESGPVQYACHLIGDRIFKPVDEPFAFCEPSYKKFGFSLVIKAKWRKWVLGKDHEELADYLVQRVLYAQSFGTTAPRIIVCGGKNVGKSTFLRFLMNMTLNVCDKIFHLEADPGQSEFTPSGCVSLTEVKEPLLGPAFTHPRKPVRMCYVGGVTVENTPDLYSSSVEQLILYHRSHLANHPLFINTMGWTSGLGLSLLVDILRAAQPTVIVQFDCGPDQVSHNLPMLTSEFLYSACGWNSSRELLNVSESELKVLAPPCNQRTLATSAMAAPVQRNLAIFSYMGKLQKPYFDFKPLNCFVPYSIPWSSVAIHCCHEEVPPDQIMHVINGSLVALCHVDDSKIVDHIPDYPKILTENPENLCYGFGLVRGIDMNKKLFLVVTPEKLPSLQGVNAFLIGSGKTPDEFFTSQEVEGVVPFVSYAVRKSKGLTSPLKGRVHRQRFKAPRAICNF